MAKVKLLKGSHPDVVSANVNSLKSAGMSHNQAMHLSMKHASKKHGAKAKSIAKKVSKKSDMMSMKMVGGYNA